MRERAQQIIENMGKKSITSRAQNVQTPRTPHAVDVVHDLLAVIMFAVITRQFDAICSAYDITYMRCVDMELLTRHTPASYSIEQHRELIM